MFTNNTLVVILVASALFFTACGGSNPGAVEAPETTSSDYSAVEPEGAMPGAGPHDSDWAEESRVEQVRHPCDSYTTEDYDRITKPLTTESLQRVFKEVKECDPVGSWFEIDGHLRRGAQEVRVLRSAVYRLHPLWEGFEELSLTKRRAIVGVMAPLVAKHAVDYLHRDHLERWLLDLEWEDIEAIDPAWYKSIAWPMDDDKPVDIVTDDGTVSVSKNQLWVRMFWLRRGEAMFNIAQDAVREQLKNP